jgi:AraC-like DNA-binding protein
MVYDARFLADLRCCICPMRRQARQLQEVAAEAHLAASTVSRFARCLPACTALLANPKVRKLHVADIALRSGFSDVSYFNRRFKLRFGLTPNGLRSETALTSRNE